MPISRQVLTAAPFRGASHDVSSSYGVKSPSCSMLVPFFEILELVPDPFFDFLFKSSGLDPVQRLLATSFENEYFDESHFE